MKKIMTLLLIVFCSIMFTSSVYASTNVSLCASGCDYDNLDDALDYGNENRDIYIHIMDDNTYAITRDHELNSHYGYVRISNAGEGGSNSTDNAIIVEGNNHTIDLGTTSLVLLYYGNKEMSISNLNVHKDPELQSTSIIYYLDGPSPEAVMNLNNCNFTELNDGFSGSGVSKTININNSKIPVFSVIFHSVTIRNSKLGIIKNTFGNINIYDSEIDKFEYAKADYMESYMNPDQYTIYNVMDTYSNDFGYSSEQTNTFFHSKKDKIMIEENSLELNELLDDIVKGREAEGTSSDENIAKIENGKVVALKEGETNLIVTTDSGHYVHNIKLTVIKKEKTNKKGVITVKEKGKVKLAEVFDVLSDYTGEIEWTISDPSIAKIENGEIVPLKSGTITITAVIDGVTYTYNLTVTDNVPEKIMHTTIKVPITGKDVEVWVIISVVMSMLVIVGVANLILIKNHKPKTKKRKNKVKNHKKDV